MIIKMPASIDRESLRGTMIVAFGRDTTSRSGISANPIVPSLRHVRNLGYGPAPRPTFAKQLTALRAA